MAGVKRPGKRTKRTPWSYRAGTTPLHRCPAGIKLLFLLLLSAAPLLGLPAAAGTAALILVGALSVKLTVRELLAGSRPLAIMLVAFTLFRAIQLFPLETAAAGELKLNLVFALVSLDMEALQSGLYLAGGILVCFAAASLFFAVTTTTEIRHSLSYIELFLFRLVRGQNSTARKQGRLSLGLALMLGFLPRFFECWENAGLAARARCCTGGLKRIIIILPLVTERMIETAAETAEALESRGLEV
jgi:energy-coupling factor transporter transmembrane protein EcfT